MELKMSIFFQFATMSVARSKGALVGRRALADIIHPGTSAVSF